MSNNSNNNNSNNYPFQNLVLEAFKTLNKKIPLSKTKDATYEIINKLVEPKYQHELFMVDSSKKGEDVRNKLLSYQKEEDWEKIIYAIIYIIIADYTNVKLEHEHNLTRSLLTVQVATQDNELSKEFNKMLDYLDLPQHVNAFTHSYTQLLHSNFIANDYSFVENETFVLKKNDYELRSVIQELTYEDLLDYVEITNFDVNTVCHILSNSSKHADKLHKFFEDKSKEIKNIKPTVHLLDSINQYEFDKFIDKKGFDNEYFLYHKAREKFGNENDDWINYRHEMPLYITCACTHIDNEHLQDALYAYVERKFSIIDYVLSNELVYDNTMNLEQNLIRLWLLIKMTDNHEVKSTILEKGLRGRDSIRTKTVGKMIKRLKIEDDMLSFNSTLKDELQGTR